MKFFVLIALFSIVFNSEPLPAELSERDLLSISPTLVKDTVEKYGYNYELHKVTTKDGYINTIWRIPSKKETPNKIGKPIIMQHGVADTGFTWVQQKNNSLAFLLVNEGYDVWLTNIRGGYKSHDHVSLNASQPNGKYWDFSLDEEAGYDLPASIEYVKEKTGYEKVDYLGHSQGTAIFFIKYMDDPEYIMKNIGRFVGLGVVPSLAHSPTEVFKLLAPFHDLLRTLVPVKKMLFFNDFIHSVLVEFTKIAPGITTSLAELFTGYHHSHMTNYGNLPQWFYYYPGGTSKQNLLHWLQCYIKKGWRHYDYGSKAKNQEKYGADEPPAYDKENYKKWNIPTLLTVSENDVFSSKEDIMEFYSIVEKKELIHLVDAKEYNHGDILFAPKAVEEIFSKILEFLREEEPAKRAIKKNLRN